LNKARVVGRSQLANAKFLATRTFNPSNADRFFYKNHFFLPFIDMRRIDEFYAPAYSGGVILVEQCETYHLQKKSYIASTDPSTTMRGAVHNVSLESLARMGTRSFLKKNMNNLSGGGDSKDDETDAAPTNTEINVEHADQIDQEEDDVKQQIAGRILQRDCMNLGAFKDMRMRINYASFNDVPLIDIALYDQKKEKQRYLHFYREFEPLYRFLHMYKYQTNRLMWTGSEMVTMAQMKYLIKTMFRTAADDAKTAKVMHEKLYITLCILAVLDKLKTKIKNMTAAVSSSFASVLKTSNRTTADQLDQEDRKEAQVDNNSDNTRDENKNTTETTGTASSLGGARGSRRRRGGSMMDSFSKMASSVSRTVKNTASSAYQSTVNKYQFGKIVSKLLKFYDFYPPVMNINRAKYSMGIISQKFPTYMKQEVIYALLVAISILSSEENKDGTTVEGLQTKLKDATQFHEISIPAGILPGQEKKVSFSLKITDYDLKECAALKPFFQSDDTNDTTENKDMLPFLGALYQLSRKTSTAGQQGGGRGVGRDGQKRRVTGKLRRRGRHGGGRISDFVSRTVKSVKSLVGESVFYEKLNVVFRYTYENMLERWRKRIVGLAQSSVVIRNQPAHFWVAEFFRTIFDRTRNIMMFLQGTIAFNIVQFYSLGLLAPPQFLASLRLFFYVTNKAAMIVGDDTMKQIENLTKTKYIPVDFSTKELTKFAPLSSFADTPDLQNQIVEIADEIYFAKILSTTRDAAASDQAGKTVYKVQLQFLDMPPTVAANPETKVYSGDKLLRRVAPIPGVVGDENVYLSPNDITQEKLAGKFLMYNERFVGKCESVSVVNKRMKQNLFSSKNAPPPSSGCENAKKFIIQTSFIDPPTVTPRGVRGGKEPERGKLTLFCEQLGTSPGQSGKTQFLQILA
jgi:hypothetical protein